MFALVLVVWIQTLANLTPQVLRYELASPQPMTQAACNLANASPFKVITAETNGTQFVWGTGFCVQVTK